MYGRELGNLRDWSIHCDGGWVVGSRIRAVACASPAREGVLGIFPSGDGDHTTGLVGVDRPPDGSPGFSDHDQRIPGWRPRDGGSPNCGGAGDGRRCKKQRYAKDKRDKTQTYEKCSCFHHFDVLPQGFTSELRFTGVGAFGG
jgi:hypothetical protein